MWLCMVLPHATDAPVCEMNELLNCQYVLFRQNSIIKSTKHQTSHGRISSLALEGRFGKLFMGATHILSSAAHRTSACSLQMGDHLKGNYTGFERV